jgi:hypothetical protein
MCLNKFSESNLGDKVSRVLSLDITCTYGQSAIPVVINFFMFGCILLIARYWHNSRNRYVCVSSLFELQSCGFNTIMKATAVPLLHIYLKLY